MSRDDDFSSHIFSDRGRDEDEEETTTVTFDDSEYDPKVANKELIQYMARCFFTCTGGKPLVVEWTHAQLRVSSSNESLRDSPIAIAALVVRERLLRSRKHGVDCG